MSSFDPLEFIRTIDEIRRKAKAENRLIVNPSDEELKRLLAKEPGIRKTVYESYVAESEPTSRAAMFTKTNIDQEFGEKETRLLAQCERVLANERLISIDRTVGNRESDTTARLIVPERFAHVAFGGKHLFIDVLQEVKKPTYQVIFFADEAFDSNKSKPLPEKDITIRLAMLGDGRVAKVVRNSSYIGEFKKGIFAAEDWTAKTKRGGIFLHAGCREDYLQSTWGDYREVRTLLLALSANGKTSTTCTILARKGKEKSWIVQDDGGTLMPDGSFHGWEAGGIFVKTEGVNPGNQIEIFYGLLKPDTICENVHLTHDGYFNFFNLKRTSNGRAVVLRRDFMHTSPYIDVDRIDNIILITRGPLIPAIAKLTMEQAVALMILGQAMESSAGDPTKSGMIRSEFFYDPFMVGDKAFHANRFYEILKRLPNLNFYLLNTGGVGERESYKEITIDHTKGILDSLLRGGFDDIWEDSPSGFKVPRAIRTVDDIYLHPELLYSNSEFEKKQKELNSIRSKAIQEVGEALHPAIKKVFY